MAIVRRSKKRDAILHLMQGTDCHPSADWVYQQLKPEFPDLSLGTVYRNLNQLREEKLIRQVGVVNGQERFDADTRVHGHFVCGCCGAVIDVPDYTPGDKVIENLSKEYGFMVEGHEFYLRGLCETCYKNEIEKEKVS